MIDAVAACCFRAFDQWTIIWFLLFIMQFDAPVILKIFFLINNEKPH